MVKTIQLNKKQNYMIDSVSGDIIERYDSNNKNLNLIIKTDNSMIKVDADSIKTEYGGQIVVVYNNDKFIIDDGYQDILIKSGYIVYKDYDCNKIINIEEGHETLEKIFDETSQKILEISEKFSNSPVTLTYNSKYEAFCTIDTDSHVYTIMIDRIDDIVNKNNIRKDNSLPFYPFDKVMDKFGTIYLSIFAQKKHKETDKNIKYKTAASLTAELLYNLGSDYHYINMPIKRRVIHWNKI